MSNKKFTEATDPEIWEDLRETEEKARLVNESPLFQSLRTAPVNWCCSLWSKTSTIRFQDGLQIRVHFCPRCGRAI